jgi:HPt (histidine-containing phosphotransfer) domain-containing protein
MDGYVAKPVRPSDLWAALAAAVPGASAVPPAEDEPPELPAAPDAVVLDGAALLRRLGGNAGLLARILVLFEGDCGRLLGEMQAALAEGDADRLARPAHTLKGTLGNLSAGASCAVAVRLEALARRGELAEAQRVFPQLEAEIGRLRTALAALGAAHPTSSGERV